MKTVKTGMPLAGPMALFGRVPDGAGGMTIAPGPAADLQVDRNSHRLAHAAHHAEEADERTAALFTGNTISRHGMDNLFSTRPATENRIAALPALAQERGST